MREAELMARAHPAASLQKRHYVALAAWLNSMHPGTKVGTWSDIALAENEGAIAQWELMARNFTDWCEAGNERFDRARFEAACRGEK